MLGRRTLRAQRLFTRGQYLATQGHLEAALTAYEAALALGLHTAGLHLHYALALSDFGRFADAVTALQTALALKPHHPVLPMFLGQIYFDHGVYEQAATWCAQTLARSPSNSHALGLQALIALVTGQVARGYEAFRKPLPLPISAAERALLWLGRSHLPSVLQQANNALQSRVLLAIETLLLQQHTAVHTLSQQLLEHPEAAEDEGLANRLLGGLDYGCLRVLMGLRQFSTRLRYLGRAEQCARQLRLLQAEKALYLGQAATAEALYTACVTAMPAPSFLLERLCELCYMQGKFPAALQHLRRALKQLPPEEPPSAWQYLLLGELLYQAGKYCEAYAALQQAADSALCDYKLFYYLGLCQLRRGEAGLARRTFATALQQLHPDIVRLRLDELYRVTLHLPHASS